MFGIRKLAQRVWVLEKQVQTLQQELVRLREEQESVNIKLYNRVADNRETLKSIIDIGVDVDTRTDGRSWAVICVGGKMDYIRFIDLSERDIGDISIFLRKFPSANKVIDAPRGMFDIFKR